MSIINIRPLIHQSSSNRFLLTNYSDRHYAYNCGGKPYLICFAIANKIAIQKKEANKRDSTGNWVTIEFAIIPMPNNPRLFYVEDRSVWRPI